MLTALDQHFKASSEHPSIRVSESGIDGLDVKTSIASAEQGFARVRFYFQIKLVTSVAESELPKTPQVM